MTERAAESTVAILSVMWSALNDVLFRSSNQGDGRYLPTRTNGCVKGVVQKNKEHWNLTASNQSGGNPKATEGTKNEREEHNTFRNAKRNRDGNDYITTGFSGKNRNTFLQHTKTHVAPIHERGSILTVMSWPMSIAEQHR